MADTGARIVVGDEEVGELLGELLERIENPRPALEEIGEAMVSSTQRRFETGRGPDGKRWPESRRARMAGGQTLVDTARLRNSIGYEVQGGRVVVGTNVKYGPTHQFGARQGAFGSVAVRVRQHSRKGRKVRAHTRTQKLPWGAIPPRPFLGIDADDRADIIEILEGYLLT